MLNRSWPLESTTGDGSRLAKRNDQEDLARLQLICESMWYRSCSPADAVAQAHKRRNPHHTPMPVISLQTYRSMKATASCGRLSPHLTIDNNS